MKLGTLVYKNETLLNAIQILLYVYNRNFKLLSLLTMRLFSRPKFKRWVDTKSQMLDVPDEIVGISGMPSMEDV